MELININEIAVSPARQRKYFDEGSIIDLADEILKHGLLHAPVLRAENNTLVAGERRLRALRQLIATEGCIFEYHGTPVPPGQVPITRLSERDETSYYEAELSENLSRLDLTWQDRAVAVANLHEMRAAQRGDVQSTEVTAAEISLETGNYVAAGSVEASLDVVDFLDDPTVASASSLREARKLVKIKVHRQENEQRAEEFKASSANPHHLILGDAIELLVSLPDNHFDTLITDPPYGIGADSFGDQTLIDHDYEDNAHDWGALMEATSRLSYLKCKNRSHAYVFCDITTFAHLADFFELAGWDVWPRPLIWHKGNVGTLPRPNHGPRYTYEAILFASKGNKEVYSPGTDVLLHRPPQRTRHAAEKPVELYIDLLRRVTRPGDQILDPFCGSGTVFPAANILALAATGIEESKSSFGIASGRLEEGIV